MVCSGTFGRVEVTLLRRGWITVPDEADVGTFVLADGRFTAKHAALARTLQIVPTLGALFAGFLTRHPANKEPGV